MIQSAQQRAALQQQAQADTASGNIATVASVSSTGVTLILPGDTAAGSKIYPYNHSYVFSAGQRVHIAREGGTIIAEYPLDGAASPVDLSNYYTKAQVDAQVSAYALAVKHGYTGTEAEWLESLKCKPIDAYPVGSIYISVASTSPATLFGGTWERLKDRFLLGAGDTYTAGATGGAPTHTQTEGEMPIHTHGTINYTTGFTGGSQTGNVTVLAGTAGGTPVAAVQTAGGGNPFSIMPPYLAVYMWQRTA